jgi:hypothetical protein
MIHADDQRRIVEDWMPRARTAGLRAAASKSPASHFGRLAVGRVISHSSWLFRACDDLADACGWLRSLPD